MMDLPKVHNIYPAIVAVIQSKRYILYIIYNICNIIYVTCIIHIMNVSIYLYTGYNTDQNEGQYPILGA